MKKLLLFSSLILCSPAQSFQKLTLMGNYCLDTVKSDLCIGDNITQHNSFLSQLGAGVRLGCYNYALGQGIVQLGEALGTPPTSLLTKDIQYPELTTKHYIAGILFFGTIIPIIEELIFTYLPRIVITRLPQSWKKFAILLPAYGFAEIHRENNYNNYLLFKCGLNNYMRHSYLLKRNTNWVPIISHIVHNGLCFASALTKNYLNSKR